MPAKLIYFDSKDLVPTDELPAQGAILSGPDSIVPTKDPVRRCRIFKQDGHWTIEDLGAPGGTLVNDKLVQRAVLVHKDRIHCGPLQVQFTDPPPPKPPNQKIAAPPPEDLEQKLSQALAGLAEKTGTLNQTQNSLEQTLAENRRLQQDLKKSKQQEDQADRLRVAVEEDNRKLREQAGAHEKEISDLRHLVELRRDENLARVRENQVLAETVARLQKELVQLKAESKEQTSGLVSDQAASKRERDILQTALEQSRKDALAVQGRLKAKEEEVGQLRAAHVAQNARIEDMEKILQSSSKLVEDARAGNMFLTAQVRDLLAKDKGHQEELAKYAAATDTAVRRQQQAERDLRELQEKIHQGLPVAPDVTRFAAELQQVKNLATVACRGLDDAFFELQVYVLKAREGFLRVEGQIGDAAAAQQMEEVIKQLDAQTNRAKSCVDGLRALAR